MPFPIRRSRRRALSCWMRMRRLGQLDQVGDEVTFVQPIDADAFEHVDFTFFCGSDELTRRHWRQALRAGSTVLDLSGALDQEPGVLVRAPWIGIGGGECRPVYARRGSRSPRGSGAGAGDGTAAAGGAGAVRRRHAADAGQRVWPRAPWTSCTSRR